MMYRRYNIFKILHTGNPASNGTKDTTVHSLEGSGDDSGDEIANGNAGETKMEGGEAVHEGSEQQLEQPEQQQPSEVPTDGSQQPIVIDSDDAISSPPPVTSSSFCCTQEQIKEAIEHGQKTVSVRDQSATLSQMNMHSKNDDRGWKSFLTAIKNSLFFGTSKIGSDMIFGFFNAK